MESILAVLTIPDCKSGTCQRSRPFGERGADKSILPIDRLALKCIVGLSVNSYRSGSFSQDDILLSKESTNTAGKVVCRSAQQRWEENWKEGLEGKRQLGGWGEDWQVVRM